MKYIRTKNEVIDISTWEEQENYYENKWYIVVKNSILARANTIEELCDQFVFVDDFYLHEHRVCHSFENAIALSKKHNVDIKTFRGAIWTDEGLIYVAKMNEKGELELL